MKEPIITLDGEMWDRNELTQKAIQDSFYYGYLAKACLSSSAISQLLKSPLEYLNQINLPTESDALAQGYLFHASILEEDKFNECLFLDVKTKANKEYKLRLKTEFAESKHLRGDRLEPTEVEILKVIPLNSDFMEAAFMHFGAIGKDLVCFTVKNKYAVGDTYDIVARIKGEDLERESNTPMTRLNYVKLRKQEI